MVTLSFNAFIHSSFNELMFLKLSVWEQDVKMVAWHPGGDLLVSASYDDSIKVWGEDANGDEWICRQSLEGTDKTRCAIQGITIQKSNC